MNTLFPVELTVLDLMTIELALLDYATKKREEHKPKLMQLTLELSDRIQIEANKAIEITKQKINDQKPLTP